MTRLRTCRGEDRMPRMLAARLRLAPWWAWKRHPRLCVALAAAAVLAAAAAAAAGGARAGRLDVPVIAAGMFFLITGACTAVWGVAAAVVLAVRHFRRRPPGPV